MSGHMFFGEGFYGHDDALYGGARLLRIVADSGKSVTELLADVPKHSSRKCERTIDDRQRLINIPPQSADINQPEVRLILLFFFLFH